MHKKHNLSVEKELFIYNTILIVMMSLAMLMKPKVD